MRKKTVQTSDKGAQPQDKYVLRMPDGLRERIKLAADTANRSMNAEIIRILEREFPAPTNLISRINRVLNGIGLIGDAITNEEAQKIIDDLSREILAQGEDVFPDKRKRDLLLNSLSKLREDFNPRGELEQRELLRRLIRPNPIAEY